jgi:hypothetical protein
MDPSLGPRPWAQAPRLTFDLAPTSPRILDMPTQHPLQPCQLKACHLETRHLELETSFGEPKQLRVRTPTTLQQIHQKPNVPYVFVCFGYGFVGFPACVA